MRHLAVLAATCLLLACAPAELAPPSSSYRGMTLGLFPPAGSEYIRSSLEEMNALGVNAVSLVVPRTTPDVRSESFGYGPEVTPSDATVVQAIRQARALDMRVMLLPIIFVEHLEEGEWRGTLAPKDWDAWFRRYEALILDYARMAQAEGVELFSVGSELCSTEHMEQRWRALIAKVRRIYQGRLFYSANWDHYQGIGFLDALDYSGVNAYYQLTEESRPTVQDLVQAWAPIRQALLAWSRAHGRPLLFTEVGYPSREGSAIDPWNHSSSRPASAEEQRRCYRAFVEAWRDVNELSGVFFYLWWGDGGVEDRDYTPRNKPAARELARWFGGGDPAKE